MKFYTKNLKISECFILVSGKQYPSVEKSLPIIRTYLFPPTLAILVGPKQIYMDCLERFGSSDKVFDFK